MRLCSISLKLFPANWIAGISDIIKPLRRQWKKRNFSITVLPLYVCISSIAFSVSFLFRVSAVINFVSFQVVLDRVFFCLFETSVKFTVSSFISWYVRLLEQILELFCSSERSTILSWIWYCIATYIERLNRNY